jgi:hypothetical protein
MALTRNLSQFCFPFNKKVEGGGRLALTAEVSISLDVAAVSSLKHHPQIRGIQAPERLRLSQELDDVNESCQISVASSGA